MLISKALKKLMLNLRKTQPIKINEVVESDEIYATAGLEGRNNGQRIKKLSRKT